MTEHRRGLLLAGSAYLMWGLVPIYFKAVASVPAHEILAHRIVWSIPIAILLIVALRQPWQLREIVSKPRLFGTLILSALLVSTNWFIYTWAVTHERVLDTSLGYFINPLLTIALGVLVLRERLSGVQKLALLLAAFGVGWLIYARGTLPWIALGLALSFGLYGLIRKRTAVNAINGFLIETAVLMPVALIYLSWLHAGGQGQFVHAGWWLSLLLVFGGVVTAVPLSLFAAGVQRIPLTTLGFLQYLSPSLVFLLAVFVYHEPFDHDRLVSFACIWTGLALLTGHNLWQRR
ncbi:EamA family transporter RarD [Permianibacter sp. IMCC34836]|uniref:EamA family transporter RarD n=1 Tax=Permianibacter fluminis TaxID=2738515 RepID=UPI0015565A49|nr:EamA family transporter RarD [Permianibacter fluminis]NQD35512.1 EamA family transporter RarD [Permianibacter fluminis]